MLLDFDHGNGTNVSDRVFLVPTVEPHFIHGFGHHCLDLHDPAFPRPGLRSPWWYRPTHPARSKFLEKMRLQDLIARAAVLKHTAINNAIARTNNPPPPYHDPTVNIDKVDRFNRSIEDEYAYRSGWLPVNPGLFFGFMWHVISTVVAAWNVNRNHAMI